MSVPATYGQVVSDFVNYQKRTTVTKVQLDSLVALKIIRHYESERLSGAGDIAQGYLTGLIEGDDQCLEVTNCFPMPKMQADDDEEYINVYQTEMLKKFRNVNVDYLLVGFYQSAPFGSCFNDTFVESLFDYQSIVEDSICLIYDPVKTLQGNLVMKAYRLSQNALKLCYKDFSPESIKKMGLTYDTLFEELPVTIRNSHLVNILLCEIALKQTTAPMQNLLDLGTGGTLEKSVRQLMGHVDNLNTEMNKYSRYVGAKQKQDSARDAYNQKRHLENENRRARGEPPLPEDDVNKLFKPLAPPTMLDGMLAASQIRTHLDHTIQVAAQNLGKIFLTEAIVEEKRDSK